MRASAEETWEWNDVYETRGECPWDIGRWKTKRLEGLTLPLAALYPRKREQWHPWLPRRDESLGEVEIQCHGDQAIYGRIADGLLTITYLILGGKGSGEWLREFFLPALEQSRGTLEAVIMWDGGEWDCGDAISRLIVRDGTITWEEIEL